MNRTLDSLVAASPTVVKGALAAALLAGAVSTASAELRSPHNKSFSGPSVCELREDRLFSSGMESTLEAQVTGVQDCDTGVVYESGVSLPSDQAYRFAVLTDSSEYNSSGTNFFAGFLPDGASFNGTTGVFSWSPQCVDQGSNPVDFEVNGSFAYRTIDFAVDCVQDTVVIEGLDFEGDGAVTSTPYHGTWSDADNDGTIDQTVYVREGKGSPYEAWVVTDKASVNVAARAGANLPFYVSVFDDRIDIQPPDGFEGDSGVLELEVCDNNSPFACRDLNVPYEIVDRIPEIVGLSYTEPNGTIDNPVDGGFFEHDVNVACNIPFLDSRYVGPRHFDIDQSFQIINPAPGMGINPSTGGIGFNPDCQNVGQSYFPSARIVSDSGSSTYKTAQYVVTNGVTQQSETPQKRGYR